VIYEDVLCKLCISLKFVYFSQKYFSISYWKYCFFIRKDLNYLIGLMELNMKNLTLSIESVGNRMFRSIAESFPIACASDEFYFFPHIKLSEPQWKIWDQFSDESVEETTGFLSSCEKELKELNEERMDIEEQIDIRILIKFARTLREQLSFFKLWKIQPTFYLTIVCKGLEEALYSKEPAAIHERASTLPSFLKQASGNLTMVPLIYRDLGMKMVSDTKHYLELLAVSVPELRQSLAALIHFENTLRKVSITKKQYFPYEMLEHLVRFHFASEMNPEEIDLLLDQEIDEMKKILTEESGKIINDHHFPESSTWQEVYDSLPQPDMEGEEKISLYSNQVKSLRNHCFDHGFVSQNLIMSCPVRVATMPAYMSAIRSASSYSISPEQPSTEGTFYILDNKSYQENLREFRMLTAHETYPGHHLLDSSRLNLARSCRRPVEQPIFYEGWACFAEELMRTTGKFTETGDKFILAKRRLWRAVRGKVDLGLQRGRMDFTNAAEYIMKMTGITPEKSLSSLKKYTLNPGYQLCYTLGIQKFMDLYHKYGQNHLSRFVRILLNQGEIGFSDLELFLNKKSL
jgi:hypothetical protein